MSKTYFIMNDRADSSKGYTQVSEDYIKGYIDGFTDGKPYFVNLGYAVMETTKENYLSYYKDWARERYINRLDKQNQLLSFDALDSDEFNGSDIVVDSSEHFEDVIDRKLMAQRLPKLISKLNEAEKELILNIYFRNISERELAKKMNIPRATLQYRKNQILNQLKNFFENL